ncbi:Zinc finger, C2H2-type/integrase, DNA-binding protein [Cordyceps fumosorosea ARSEF 2679]|uniref:Zinc finger, C2H2-type/integrase, DNA-binding protein n=1 Tax=Cordyceps fumosorosea (strain ARSEF 2679) TaxID=1081104 RepID=A0A167TIV1_CORFA|nr:Zinc finger, C2H2-type/integrase, DNA-binding protein [Cordyceps fumosorosea ARSEF 2679]OAA60641.1 Zinc finger, C2H2-type/integrase, DNA-binding protein [Cordyceps fumosorosea ARSEF 2679]
MAVSLAYPPTTSSQLYNRPPRPPPSPPMDDSRCSLPSISNLLGLADAGSPTTDPSPTSYRGSPKSEASFSFSQHGRSRRESGNLGSRPGSRHSGAFQHHHRRGLPPTPPLSTDSAYDGYSSPSSQARGHFPFDSSSSSSSSRFHETTPPLEQQTELRQQLQAAASRAPRLSIPVPPQRFASGHPQHAAAAAAAAAPPGYYGVPAGHHALGQQPVPHHHYAAQHHHHHHQQALPQSFPPTAEGQQLWQHHHYLHPSQSSVYPQSQDKYLCPTCNKAFSRPSSLRIHSHSHTGEKPYKCAHPGCGKAFSVRSNMKRHERGCHSASAALGSRAMV